MPKELIFNVLVVIDLQKQFKDNDGKYEKCVEYVKTHFKDSYVLGTVFKNSNDSMYEKYLNWSGCKVINYTSKGTSEDIEYPYHKLILKKGYGINSADMFADSLKDIYYLASKQQNNYIPKIKYQLIGCDADACVLASAFNFWDRGYNFEILSDYIYTTAKDINIDSILRIMKRNFGTCLK